MCKGTNCLEHEWTRANNESAESTRIVRYCPVKHCRKEICPSMIEHVDLPINQTIVDLIDSCNFHVETIGSCEICHQSASFVKCSHCSLLACFECANRHRRDTLTTLTNDINTVEQEYLTINDQIDRTRQVFAVRHDQTLEQLRTYYQRLIEQLNNERQLHSS
jgi:hypothetical protein